MNILRKLADNENSTSAANSLRRARFQLFLSLIETLPRPVRVLDVGGTEQYWQTMGLTDSEAISVTLVNIVPVATTLPNFSSITADACDLHQLADDSFDVVFSNSAIEHVPTPEGQARMASEILRLAPRYYVQTPNRYFPLEPHYLFPCFQFFPIWLKALLLRTVRLGWAGRARSWSDAMTDARSIRLLSRREMRRLFPDGDMTIERFFALPKSLVVTRAA